MTFWFGTDLMLRFFKTGVFEWKVRALPSAVKTIAGSRCYAASQRLLHCERPALLCAVCGHAFFAEAFCWCQVPTFVWMESEACYVWPCRFEDMSRLCITFLSYSTMQAWACVT
jgi:hypothetical protein